MDQVPEWAIRTAADRAAIAAGYGWNEAAAAKVLRFAEAFIKPQFIASEFHLLPWQSRFLQSLYGWTKPTGGRRWRKAILHVAKKNGKTLLTSIIALYELLVADVPSPLVCSASTTIKNAKQIYDELQHTISKVEKFKNGCRLVESQKTIRCKRRNAEYRSLSADASNAEGLNLSLVISDETAHHRSEKLFRTLEYSTIARPDGLLISISTSSDDVSHFYYSSLYMKAKNVLSGADLDLQTYAEVHECPVDADPEDKANWYAANPSLGVSFSEESFAADLAAAKGDAGSWNTFLKYRLNMWVSVSGTNWLSLAKWDLCRQDVPEADLKAAPCVLGIDLSATTDPTSVSACFALGNKKYALKSWAFVCREGVLRREALNLPKYQQFASEGTMTITDGDVIDQPRVKAFILELIAKYNVKECVFDSYNAITLATELGQYRTTYRFPQNYKYYNDPCKQFEIAISERRIFHDGNSLLRWGIQNVRLDQDSYSNVKPSREKSSDKIDMIVSSLMAFARCSELSATATPRASVYDTRGIMAF